MWWYFFVTFVLGAHLTFEDSDDTLPPNALEILMVPVNDDTDITIGKYAGAPYPPAGELPLAEYRKKCANMQGILVAPFARLFRRRLFDEETFNLPPELRVGEDALMNIRLAYKATG